MSDADCNRGREPCSVAASFSAFSSKDPGEIVEFGRTPSPLSSLHKAAVFLSDSLSAFSQSMSRRESRAAPLLNPDKLFTLSEFLRTFCIQGGTKAASVGHRSLTCDFAKWRPIFKIISRSALKYGERKYSYTWQNGLIMSITNVRPNLARNIHVLYIYGRPM